MLAATAVDLTAPSFLLQRRSGFFAQSVLPLGPPAGVGAAGDPAAPVLLTSASAVLRELLTYDGLRVHICVTRITQILKFRETGGNSFNMRGKHRVRLNVKIEVKHSI